MKTTANIATYPGRESALVEMLKSIDGQFDFIRICANGYTNEAAKELASMLGQRGSVFVPEEDKADNGKFLYLDVIEDPEYYFTLDDDIIYPGNYVSETLKYLAEFGSIITYHGRKLQQKGVDYYKGHLQYHCLNEQKEALEIDVMGSGVAAFDTRYFHPKGLADDKRLRMADLVISLEAAKQNKVIGLAPHKRGWFKLVENIKETIYDTETKKGTPIQNQIANEIFDLRNENKDTE